MTTWTDPHIVDSLRREALSLALSLIIYRCARLVVFSACVLLSAGAQEPLIVPGTAGCAGGRLVYGQRTEAKTLNPITAIDAPSREVIAALMADLIHINRATLKPELALAKSYKASTDGLRYDVELRPGLRFSDGHP